MKRNIISLSRKKKIISAQTHVLQRSTFGSDWSITNSTLSEERRTFTDVCTEKLTHSHQNIGLAGFFQTVRKPYFKTLILSGVSHLPWQGRFLKLKYWVLYLFSTDPFL